jgi:hypothetical protein
MKRMIVFKARGGKRIAMSVANIHRIYECDDPGVCEVIYEAYAKGEWVEQTIHVHGDFTTIVLQINMD